jgi:hypothetical protein
VFDFVELAVQVLSTKALQLYNVNPVKFLEAVRLTEDVLAASPGFGVGQWIHAARTMLPTMDDWSRDLFEFNARALITTWGGEANQVLVDYSNRQWSGLTGDFYLRRWERYFSGEGGEFFADEWEWVNRKSDEGCCYPTTGSGADLGRLAERVLEF